MLCVCVCRCRRLCVVCRCNKWWYPKKWARLIFHCIHSSNQSTFKHYSDGKGINKSIISPNIHSIQYQRERERAKKKHTKAIITMMFILSFISSMSILSFNAPIKMKHKEKFHLDSFSPLFLKSYFYFCFGCFLFVQLI